MSPRWVKSTLVWRHCDVGVVRILVPRRLHLLSLMEFIVVSHQGQCQFHRWQTGKLSFLFRNFTKLTLPPLTPHPPPPKQKCFCWIFLIFCLLHGVIVFPYIDRWVHFMRLIGIYFCNVDYSDSNKFIRHIPSLPTFFIGHRQHCQPFYLFRTFSNIFLNILTALFWVYIIIAINVDPRIKRGCF